MIKIEICGNIASGKTTLCQRFSEHGFHPVFENFQNNPFFEDFYDDPAAYSFETEITFLLQHYHSIKKAQEHNLACDFSLLLDLAYADVNLTGDRHKIFQDIVEELHREIGYPSQLIHLVCPEDILLERITSRAREVESAITIDYLKSLSNAIAYRVSTISNKIPVTVIDSDKIDFRERFDGLPELVVNLERP